MFKNFHHEASKLRDPFGQTKRKAIKKTKANAAPIWFEAIEPRQLLSASPIINVDGAGGAPVLVDFNSEPTTPIFSPLPSITIDDVTITTDGGAALLRIVPGPNGTNAVLDNNSPDKLEFRIDFANGASEVSVDLGDTGVDNDRIFLEIFDSGDNSLGFIDQVIFGGMHTLTLADPNIAYVITGARDAAGGSSVFLDNINYTPAGSADIELNEGDTANATGTFSDPDVGDIVTLSASVGTVMDTGGGTWAWSYDTGDGPADSQTVTITATDNNGDFSDVTFELVVLNVAPEIGVDNALVTVDEGDTAVNSGTLTDPGDDIDTITASVGAVINNGNGTYSWSFDTTDGPDETQTVTITVTDVDGESDDITFDLVVNNLPPDIDVDNAVINVDEGDVANNTGTFGDTGDDTVTINASVGNLIDNGNGTWSWSLATVDGPDDSVTVTITATDSDGDASSVMFDVVVDNVAPTIDSLVSSAPMTNKSLDGNVSISGGYTDPGLNDVHTVSVDWGDGSAVETISVDQLADTFAGAHSYTNGGVFEITVTVDDGDGGVAIATTEAVVVGVGLNGGVLQVIGSDGDEKITVKSKNGGATLEVKVKEKGVGTTFLDDFDATMVDSIFVSGMGGRDMITVQHAIAIDTILNGDDGNDFITGGGGNDTINGGMGDDKVFGRGGVDDIHGGDGDDMIFGNNDGDSLFGDAGADKIWGALGADIIFGGEGNDMLFGGAGDDVINGDAGNDFISGGSGNDVINGGDGNDLLMGGAGNDILGGDAGDDILIGGPGSDTLDGGDGLDLLLDGWSWVWE